MSSRRSYVPSKLLIRKINKRLWIPASAGMTRKWDSSGNDSITTGFQPTG
jgi:hypothetical protein